MVPEHLYQRATPLAYGAMASYPYSKKLEESMALFSRYGDPIQLSRREGKRLLIPRGLYRGPVGGGIVADLRTQGMSVDLQLSSLGPRNAEQVRVVKESYGLLSKGESHIVCASTGFGKTFCGLHLAGKLGLKTLVVVTKDDMAARWRTDALKFLKVTDDDIGIIQQDKYQVGGKSLCFGMVHSLAKDKYPEEIYSEFGLIIFDEVHRMGAETFSTVCGMFEAQLRLGLSATPLRVDGKEVVFESHIGPVRVFSKFSPLKPKVIAVGSDYQLPRVVRRINGQWMKVPLPHEIGKLGGVIADMAKSQTRNSLITRLAMKSYMKGRWTVVMSELARDKHLDLLANLCVGLGLPSDQIGFYVGGMSEKQLEMAKTKKMVFATYAMCSEATDVPWWDTLVMASPRANVTQPIGRILREYPDKKEPVVFDIIDACSPILIGYAAKRNKLYIENGWKVVTV